MASPPPPLKVLYHMHPALDTLDLTGPLEILYHASYTPNQKVFTPTITAATETVTTTQQLKIQRDIPLETAYANLSEYDILVIPGGGTTSILEKWDGKAGEPMDLIKKFCNLPAKRGEDGKVRERVLFTVCTGSLLLAVSGALAPLGEGVKVTTHPEFYTQMRDVLAKEENKGVELLDRRFVANPMGEGSGLRIVTCGGVSSGMDGALHLVEYFVNKYAGYERGKKELEKVELITQYRGRVDEGVVL